MDMDIDMDMERLSSRYWDALLVVYKAEVQYIYI